MKRQVGSSYSINAETGAVSVNPRSGLLRRLEPSALRVKALAELHTKLAVAAELFKSHEDDGRVGTYRAVLDVVEYFVSLGIPHATLLPLASVASALVDADNGIESKTFSVGKRASGAPKKATQQLELEGILAVIMECCVRHLKPQLGRKFLQPASELAAKIVNKSPLSIEVSATQMREIRESVAADAHDSIRQMVFREHMTTTAAKDSPMLFATTLASHDWL